MNEDQHDSTDPALTDEFLSLDEAIKFLDISKSTIYRLISQEDIKGTKVGKQWRFRKADLVAYMERGPAAATIDAASRGDLDAELKFFCEEVDRLGGDASACAESQSKTLDLKSIDLADAILAVATLSGASDIHIEPLKSHTRLRLRIDGLLHRVREIPSGLHEILAGRFKEMSDMNVNERRLPQDGRIRYRIPEGEYDIRVSLIPTNIGESIVMRILDRRAGIRGLDTFGLSGEDLARLRTALSRPSGMVLATGPSGSGKTTLLYSCLAELNSPGIKVTTIEDPIEYELPDTVQIQVRPRLGLTIEAALRSVFRQDPDVVMLGSVADRGVAEIALQGSLTGVGMLSTLHADSAIAALLRLRDMGIEQHLITSGLNAIVATRLMRRLCPDCKQPRLAGDSRTAIAAVARLAAQGGYRVPESAVFYRSGGCSNCRGTGYLGRIGIFEVLLLNPQLTGEVLRCSTQEDMIRVAVQSGMRTLFADALRRAAEGESSIEEALRVTDTSL